MRDHFQLSILWNSLPNKYIFRGHYFGKSELLTLRDSQFLSSSTESRDQHLHCIYCPPLSSLTQNMLSLHIFCEEGGVIWTLTSASSETVRFGFFFFTVLYIGCSTLCNAIRIQNLLCSPARSSFDFVHV